MRCLPLILITGCVLAVPTGLAQERSGAEEAKPRPSGRAWLKLCETHATANKDLFGKSGVIGSKTCLIHHERLDGTSGAVVVAAAVRQTGGQQTFTVMVPAGAQRTAGLRLYIYPGNLWEKVQRRERLEKRDLGRLGVVKLRFAFCHAGGCTAETNATPELVADLKSNAGLMVFAVKNRRPIAYPVPLSGFREAYDGPSVDRARYNRARKEVIRRIRERQKQRGRPSPSNAADQDI